MGFLSFTLVYFRLSHRSYLVFKWLAPLGRARIALLGLYHLLAILFLSHSILQPIHMTVGRNNFSLIDVTSHHSFMVLRLGTANL
jgi:hypothetical protein